MQIVIMLIMLLMVIMLIMEWALVLVGKNLYFKVAKKKISIICFLRNWILIIKRMINKRFNNLKRCFINYLWITNISRKYKLNHNST